MTLDPQSLARLDAAARLTRCSRLGRMLRRPLHLSYSKLLEWRAYRRRQPEPCTASTFWGQAMTVVAPDNVSLTIYRYGFFEEDLTRLLLQTLRPGMTFFDVGSHFGYFSLLALALVGPKGAVHAFEPTPSTFKVLEGNLKGQTNARLNNVAVYAQETTLQFHDYGMAFPAFNSVFAQARLDAGDRKGLQPTEYPVQAVTVDGYVAATGARPDFLKIDAEGAEDAILQGMVRTLRDHRPRFTLEVGDKDVPGALPCRQLLQHVLDQGYEILECPGGTPRPHQLKERYRYDNLLCVPR